MEFLDVSTIGIYPMNWQYVSKRYFDMDTKHIVIPKNQKDEAVEILKKYSWRTPKLKKICKNVIDNIHTDHMIKEIDNFFPEWNSD